MEPEEQGDLDRLCGVYCIINAVEKIIRSDKHRKTLFKKAISYLNDNEKLIRALTIGIRKTTMIELMENITPSIFQYYTPFTSNKNVSIDAIWNKMKTFLNEEDHRVIIICINGKEWDHWAVIERITKTKIYFYDAILPDSFDRKACSTTVASPHLIKPTHVFFIKKFN